jgi:uncharacterized RDD family membrane protein YckC
MSAPQITLQTVTGVDIQLRIAGPGSRSYAFIIDWHIRVLMALAWFAVAALILRFGFDRQWQDVATADFLWTLLPPVVIYLLYHPVLEVVMRGRTPGKRIAGVRLVTRTGDTPGVGALLIRNVFRLIDSQPSFYLVGLLVVFFTKHHVRIGDLAAGTLLVSDHDNAAASFAVARSAQQGGLTPQAADLIHELLDRWEALRPEERANIARSLLARVDPALSAVELARFDAAELRAKLTALVSPSS